MSARKNKAFNELPRFIWGEAVSESGFKDHEYLIHTRYPRLICRVYEGENVDTETFEFESQLGMHPETGDLVYVTSLDIVFKDWVWLDKSEIPEAAIKSACDDAIRNYLMRDDEYGINNKNE